MSADAATSSCKTDLQTVETAVEAYKAQMGNYPDGATTGGTGVQTDSDAVTVNAASARSGSGSELLQASTASASDPNLTVTPTAGPWLKDIPSDPNHYTITVKNDGSGIISVLNPAGVSGRDCSAIS